jgi:hypothetical protein
MGLQAATLVPVPLPLTPAGSVGIADGVAFFEDVEGNGSVFLWGMASWSWTGGDRAARRLAAVQLVNSKPGSTVRGWLGLGAVGGGGWAAVVVWFTLILCGWAR